MPILTESMAPLVPSYNQTCRACLRNRDPDVVADAPLGKKMCPGGGRGFDDKLSTNKKLSAATRNVDLVQECVEFETFGPGTPTKAEEASSERKMAAGRWEALELCLLERIARSLSVADLCRLSQVNKHYKEMCARDAMWAGRAADKGIGKAATHESWRWNVKAAYSAVLHAVPLSSVADLHFTGDVAIVDPFALFFDGKYNSGRRAELRRIIERSHTDLALTYRGVQSAILRTSCAIDDDDSAFEVFRDGEGVGANVTSSGVIAVVPKRLVLQLIAENGGAPADVRGVTVVGVNGVLRSSFDGDFIIRHPEPARGKAVEIPFSGETDYADIVCSTGGSWTEETDSDDEEDLTEEEMAEAIAEVATLTNAYTTSSPAAAFSAHCNGEGLIHKFTNFEVSMLS